MRPLLSGLAVAVALTVAVSTAPIASPAPRQFVATVRCNEVVLHSRNGRPAGYRAVLGAVSAPPSYIPGTAVRDSSSAPFTHWSKAGIWIRASNAVVIVSLPREWRDRARIVWGAPGTVATAVRFGPCPSKVATWDGYSGGFLLRPTSACVPLVFSVGNRRTTLRFGVGRRC